ncbi:uncharacterized protein [Musca autumnalis]|uniref:uncharacterized protein n=1 Tax=Musca autumnalis TaxID=221902 RepID=UPI003CFAD2EA
MEGQKLRVDAEMTTTTEGDDRNADNVTLRSKKIIVPLLVDSEEEQSAALEVQTKVESTVAVQKEKFEEDKKLEKSTDDDIPEKSGENTTQKNTDSPSTKTNLQLPTKQCTQKDEMKVKSKITDGAFGDINLQLPKKNTEQDTTTKMREKEMELLKRENELLKKEKEMLVRENNLLKLLSGNNNDNVQTTEGNVSLMLVSNFLPEFDGTTDAEFWITQLRDLQQSYKLSDEMLRAIFAKKLVGRPLTWLHTRRNTFKETVGEMFEQFCLMFGSNESKLELRKKFERRVWKTDENFTDYCNDKIKLASKLKLEEDELLEYVVEGIPNIQLRRQTVMQQYKSVTDLCKALAAITLPRVSDAGRAAPAAKLDVRCYNCNSEGHYAADCSKPRRQPGTCYACGGDDHTVARCEKNKKKNAMENIYKAS